MTTNVLVIGASGFLGRAVTDTLRRREGITAHATCCRQANLDAFTFNFWRDDVTPLLEQTEADTVIFAAAVEPDATASECKRQAESFFKACTARRVIYVSSDAIFDGTKGNYQESDSPLPITQYGKNLKVFEHIVRDNCENACIVRPSYLYGFSLGELDARLSHVRQQLLAGDTVSYTEDMFKSPMEVMMAAEAITQLALTNYTGTVHLSGARTSIYDFYRAAMIVLGVPVEALKADRRPDETTIPRDTSLEATLMTKLTNVPVLGVKEALVAAP